MKNIFNKEFNKRLISALFFVPIVILPLLYSHYLSVLVYISIISVILIEINQMKNKVKYIFIFNIYSCLVISAFFLFLFLLISGVLSKYLLFGIILVIWLFDTFSFLGGKAFGGRKLMPKISSGKTVSGLVTGILMTLISTELILNMIGISIRYSVIFTISIVFLSFFGDTIVSLIKRYASIKDSGNIMPGHGGLLDRFDSFIMVFFAYGTGFILL